MNTKKIKSAFDKANRLRRSIILRKISSKMIEESACEIPKLTSKEKKEIIEYWKKYNYKPDLNLYRWFYFMSGIKSPSFITDDFYQTRYLYKLNDQKFSNAIDDKNLYDLLLPKKYLPETIVRNINGEFLDENYNQIAEEEAIKKVTKIKEKIVIKPTRDTGKGKNVKLIEPTQFSNEIKKYGKNFIVQKRIKQHKTLAGFNPESTNIIRITTMLLNNEIKIISPAIRIGDSGSFTDHGSKYDLRIGIDENGQFREYGISLKHKQSKWLKAPNGYDFSGKKVPGFYEMINTVKSLAPRFADYHVIGWDITFDINNNVRIIEMNLTTPGIITYQACNGPLYGKDTDAILSEILKK